MQRVLSDAEIADLLLERKPVTRRFRSVLAPRRRKDRPSECGRRLNIRGEGGHLFRVYVKVIPHIKNNFSIGLVWVVSKREKYLLIRCNGFHETHLNTIEGTSIPADTCHIHHRTERYDLVGKPMGYAADASLEFTNRKAATDYFVTSFGLYIRDDRELPLFDKN
jgi:hypothetical protein